MSKILIDEAVAQQALETLEATLGTLTTANEQGVIADTIWFSEHETLFDYIASEIDALRQTLEQPAIPQGYKLVPVEPTQEQLRAAVEYSAKNVLPNGLGYYKAMLNAAPTPPQQGWQPIETAPKSNPNNPKHRLMLWVERAGIQFGYVYDDGEGGAFAAPDGFNGAWTVTHWMPLPAAPTPQGE